MLYTDFKTQQIKHDHSKKRPREAKTKPDKVTNREKFSEIFGLELEEYKGYNDEFSVYDRADKTRLSCGWLDTEYIPPKRDTDEDS